MREESHLDAMREAIRGDFERLQERRGEQVVLRVRERPEIVGDASAEPEAPERDAGLKRSWIDRLLGLQFERFNRSVEKAERDSIMRQGIVLPETPRERRERAGLEEDLRSIPLRGKPISLRLRNFIPRGDAYLAASHGPRPYMLRLREIEQRTASHAAGLRAAWGSLAEAHEHDIRGFADAWQAAATSWPFDEVNDLIERHNRWYPVEARLPMDPRTGDYALVNGRAYRLEALDASWVLDRFPPALPLA